MHYEFDAPIFIATRTVYILLQVLLDNNWQLVDSHWATRYLQSERNTPENLVYEYDDFYFLPEPRNLVYRYSAYYLQNFVRVLKISVIQSDIRALPRIDTEHRCAGTSRASVSNLCHMGKSVVPLAKWWL